MNPVIAHPLRTVATVVALAFLLLLAACGGGRTQTGLIRRINPPSAALERLTVANGTPVSVAIRLQNFSTVPTGYGLLDAAVSINGWPVGRLQVEAGIDIPGLSSDVISAQLPLADADRARIDAAVTRGAALAYRLEGTIQTIDPDGRFEFEFESRLTPVPGRPGEFR